MVPVVRTRQTRCRTCFVHNIPHAESLVKLGNYPFLHISCQAVISAANVFFSFALFFLTPIIMRANETNRESTRLL